jgi:hypothetical protein
MTATVLQTMAPFESVTFDLYRDIHKGIRAELFAVTGSAGRLDPGDRPARVALADHVGRVVDLLVLHAEHEDASIQPAIEEHMPAYAEHIAADHLAIEARLVDLRALANEAVDAPRETQRSEVHRTYVELASFTSAYLAHQDYEERVVMPALETAIGVDAIIAVHQSIVSSIPPEQMAATLAIMLPAMNVDDRTALLGGMKAGAPAAVFEGVWGLAASVLTPADHAQLADRLGIA